MTAVLAPPPHRVAMTITDGGQAPKRIPRTDLGNAERFIARHGADVHWLPAWGKWMLWDGRRWRLDETLEVMRLAKATVRAIYAEADALPTRSEKKEIVNHAKRSEADSKIRAMLERAKAEPGIAITTAQLDAHPWRLACENGVIDLRTGEIREHRREDLITKIVPVPYEPHMECPRWMAFLERVLGGDQDMIAFLQRAVGYSLTGSTSERALFFLYGSGANGKSTLLEILRALLAGYAQQADFTTFLERKGDGPRNDIARLFGARLVTSSEVGEGKRLNESLVKTLTGDETVTARFLHAEFFEFKPAFKLWLAANHKPVIRGTDNAIWDRIRLIPFTVSIPIEERDKGLQAALLAELPGILAWAVQGAVEWARNGLGTPIGVRLATEGYRHESDTLGAFLEDCCELNPMWEETSSKLYSTYATWCSTGGEYQITQTAFGRLLEERGIPVVKRGGKKLRIGVRVL
jgi:putative DNA primase/helicase